MECGFTDSSFENQTFSDKNVQFQAVTQVQVFCKI